MDPRAIARGGEKLITKSYCLTAVNRLSKIAKPNKIWIISRCSAPMNIGQNNSRINDWRYCAGCLPSVLNDIEAMGLSVIQQRNGIVGEEQAIQGGLVLPVAT